MKAIETVERIIPGTRQVQITPAVTAFMVIFSWVMTEFVFPEGTVVPEKVWISLTGLIIWGLQYWHGPRA